MLKKRKKFPKERLTGAVLERVTDHQYFFTLEHSLNHYENYDWWKYLLKDILFVLLYETEFYLCIENSVDDKSLWKDFKGYESVDTVGDNVWIKCKNVDSYILITLLEDYENLWEYEGPLHFFAGIQDDKEKNPDTMEYQMKLSSLRDSMGIEIKVAEKEMKEDIIKKIKKVMDSYRLTLDFKEEGNE
ncbi:MAG: hypothetical protein J6J42_00845 [Lachnospiraceae bacterium]|nr:hypothetical protein [Lachnospiraceae bacterium]